MKFEVEEHETPAQCIERMRAAGYMPVKRSERPIFCETPEGKVEVLKQQIVFTGQKIEQ